MLSCMSSLHILDINPLSDIAFANIFSHSAGGPEASFHEFHISIPGLYLSVKYKIANTAYFPQLLFPEPAF